MTAPTHRVVGGDVRRGNEYLEPGELCIPTEAELRAFPDRFEELDTRPEGYEDADSDESDEPDGAESESESIDAPSVLEDAGIDADDYRELQAAAGEYDGVDGNLPKTELQAELAKKLVGE